MTLKEAKRRLGTRRREVIQEVRQLRLMHTKIIAERRVDQKSIGKAFRKMREDAGISLRSMAKAIGISAAFLSDAELGHRRLSLSHTVLFINQIKKV